MSNRFEKRIVRTQDDISGGSKEGGRRGRVPPLGVQILSISCSFWEILAKSYVGDPPGELAPPLRGNPGSATGHFSRKCTAHLPTVQFWWESLDVSSRRYQVNKFEQVSR